MLTTQDFTALSEGSVVPLEGPIERCPLCGRNGIAERPECASPHFLHRQATDVSADGMLTEPLDCCLLPN